MKIHDLIAGTPEWHQFRLEHNGASEAAAMLGMSPRVRRAELLRAKHTGLAREFSDWLQANVLDKGHEVEALARPHVEAIVGTELYPVTCSDGPLSASCDGLTMLEDIAWEHKQWSAPLASYLARGEMPPEHMPQCQQVLMVTGAEKLIFVVSDGTPESMLYVWVLPDPAWFQRLRDGWAMFDRDLAAYTIPESVEPAPVGKAPETLPALRIDMRGEIVASNLAEWKATALTAIRSVNRSLKTDEDFADARKAIKWCEEVEFKLAQAKEHALSQTASIDALFKTLSDIAAESKTVRLDLDKLVTRRSTEVKDEGVSRARRALDAHIATLNAEIAPMRLPTITADFAGAIKGLRTVASMQNALDGALTVAKIAAEADARAIRANLAAFQAQAAGFEFLFADLGAIVHKAADDFALLVRSRIDAHKAAEMVRENQRKAAAEAEAARRLEAAAKEAERQTAAAVAQAAASVPQSAPIVSTPAAFVAPKAAIVPPTRPDEPATLKLGMICERLGFNITADFLADRLHIKPAKVEGASRLFTERQFALICSQIVSHVSAMAELYAGETA